jgi:hypothetical protein
MPKEENIRTGLKKPDPAPTFSQDVVISLSGVGDLLDVRFKITPQMKTGGQVYVQDEATGKICKVANVPKIGTLLSGRRTAPGDYGYGIFLNMEDVVKKGSLVTFIHGTYKKEHIPVQ